MFSVSSSVRSCGRRRAASSAWVTRATRPGWPRSLPEMLTCIVRSAKCGDSVCQRFSSWQERCSTKSVSAMMRPDSSATGMNSAGLIGPSRGWLQRASASKPVSAPVPSENSGWYSIVICWAASALRRSASTVSRCDTALRSPRSNIA